MRVAAIAPSRLQDGAGKVMYASPCYTRAVALRTYTSLSGGHARMQCVASATVCHCAKRQQTYNSWYKMRDGKPPREIHAATVFRYTIHSHKLTLHSEVHPHTLRAFAHAQPHTRTIPLSLFLRPTQKLPHTSTFGHTPTDTHSLTRALSPARIRTHTLPHTHPRTHTCLLYTSPSPRD